MNTYVCIDLWVYTRDKCASQARYCSHLSYFTQSSLIRIATNLRNCTDHPLKHAPTLSHCNTGPVPMFCSLHANKLYSITVAILESNNLFELKTSMANAQNYSHAPQFVIWFFFVELYTQIVNCISVDIGENCRLSYYPMVIQWWKVEISLHQKIISSLFDLASVAVPQFYFN